MSAIPIRIPILGSALCMLLVPGKAAAAPDASGIEFFEARVRPIFAEHCYQCHSADAQERGKLKGGLRLDHLAGLLRGGDSGTAVIPGAAADSLLVEAVGYRNEDTAMPPKGKLPDAAIATLTEWVNLGAPWPGVDVADLMASNPPEQGGYDWDRFRREHWAFHPLRKPAPPPVHSPGRVRSPVDAFVLARLDAAGLEPNPLASKSVLIRRAYLDLLGLPPEPAAVEAFLRDDSPDAFARVVDDLLESRHYGERWARHWLDVARYSDGHGGFGDNAALPEAWRYRDWVVESLNADMPYDTFVRRQIAGDVLANADERDPIATGFFVVGPTYQSDGGDPEAVAQAKAETLADRVDTVSRAFLGLTAACARCHDHKFDPITTKDYYALAGIFQNTSTAEYPVVPDAEVQAYRDGQKAIKEQQDAVNRLLAGEAGRLGLKPEETEKRLDEDTRTRLAEMREELERRKGAAPPKYAFAHSLADSGNSDMHVALRGDLRKPGDLVPRRFLQIFAEGEPAAYRTGDGSGRRELAESITAPTNPLTPRVIVNRVWQWHFGSALVRTPSNFGMLGEKPTHPMLLDWLAADFVEHGWSLKHLHRRILLSATWQMSSQFDQDKFNQDGDNRLLWRMNPRKLDVEAWRDTLLAVTGGLDRTLGGPPVNAILDSRRRTIYAIVSRTGDKFDSDAFLRLFDFPAAVSSSAERVVSTVPQQYLFMMNSTFMKARARVMGEHWRRAEGSFSERIDAIYQTLYSRPAEPAETAVARQWFAEDTDSTELWSRYSQVLLSAHELLQIR